MAVRASDLLIGNKEKALLHTAKSKLGMRDEEYRALLGSVGVTSSVNLTHLLFDQVMATLEKAGFVPLKKVSRPRSSRGSNLNQKFGSDKEAMIRKIKAILTELQLPDSYADGIARNQHNVELLIWCDANQTYAVLQALIIHQRRVRRKAAASGGDATAVKTRGKGRQGVPSAGGEEEV